MKESPVKSGDLLADKYVVERVLGVGGMGVVVEAVHLDLHEARAIKVMLPEALEEKDAVERFVREARAASRLKSEYVCRVHDVGKLENGLPFIVMEHLEGTDLRLMLKTRGRIPVEEAVHYALQACEALAEAHAAGIIHRDLKPGNLFLTSRADGSPCIKVLDFGISKQLGIDDEEMTKTHTLLGSPSYMSPEQMRSPRGVDARTDIWSLGVILYRLITGELPFKGENVTSLVTLVLQSKPEPPSSVVPELSAEVDEVILRCLERELPDRWANVAELSAALLPFAPPDARTSVERIARTLSSARSSSPTSSSPGIPAPRGSSPTHSRRGSSPTNSSAGTPALPASSPTMSSQGIPAPRASSPGTTSPETSSSNAVASPPALPPPLPPAVSSIAVPAEVFALETPTQATPMPATTMGGTAMPAPPEPAPAPSVKTGAAPGPVGALRGSNDAWANTAHGGGTVALRRSTLAAAAVGVLLIGALVSLMIARRLQPAASSASPPREAVTIGASPTGDTPVPPAAPPTAAAVPTTASTVVAAVTAPPSPEPPAPATLATDAAAPPVAAAPPGAKGPPRSGAAKVGKPAEAAKAPEAPPPAQAPAPPPTAAHRVFGTEN